MANRVCPWWNAYTFDNAFRRLLHNPAQILGPYVKEGMIAADLGCDMGFFSIGLAKLVGEAGCVIAVDLQPQMLEVLQRRRTMLCARAWRFERRRPRPDPLDATLRGR